MEATNLKDKFGLTTQTVNVYDDSLSQQINPDLCYKECSFDDINDTQNKTEPNLMNVLSIYPYDKDIDFEKEADLMFNYLQDFDFSKNKESACNFINLLLRRSPYQLKKIQKIYDEKYPKILNKKGKPNLTLLEFIKKKCKGDFYELVLLLFSVPVETECKEIYEASSKMIKNYELIQRIICWKNSWNLKLLKNTFRALYGLDLLDHLKSKLNKDVYHIFEKIFNIQREGNKKPLQKRCLNDLKKMLDLKDSFWDIENEHFQTIFFKRSFSDLEFIMEEYQKEESGRLEKKLELIKNKDQRKIIKLLSLGQMRCYSELIYESIVGAGTDEDKLHEGMLALRKNFLMKEAKGYYYDNHKETMDEAIKGDVHDNEHRKILLEIMEYSMKPKKVKFNTG